MIDPKEHEYHDDPAQGPPDVRTRLAGVSYFFIGNGLVQAAIQFAPGGEGSPYGLLIQDPDRLAAKREALTFDPRTGLAATMLSIAVGEVAPAPRPWPVRARWRHDLDVPTVEVAWQTDEIAVREDFYCPDRSRPLVIRAIRVANTTDSALPIRISTGVPGSELTRAGTLTPRGALRMVIGYALAPDGRSVTMSEPADSIVAPDAVAHASEQNAVRTGQAWIDHLYRTAADQLSGTVSRGGCIDASIWQYTREWVRDHSFMAYGLLLSGHHDQARTMLDRLIRDFIAPDGSAMDSSERRAPAEAELDQNGILWTIVREYVRWTGDEAFARAHWPRLTAVADFPLSEVFRHEPSGLLANRRDFWERHDVHGIEPGLETAHQAFVALGLDAAATLAVRFGDLEAARRWRTASDRLRRAMLEDPTYALVADGRLIKRRGLDGRVQTRIHPWPEAGLPQGVRLADDIDHPLDPDTAVALPIAWGLIDPRSTLARETMASLEPLWNQRWTDGGHARYHVDSDPDSPGAWPFASAYMGRAYLDMGRDDHVWRILDWFAACDGSLSGAWFEMHGPRVAPPYAQIGIIPWAWAELITLFVRHLLGVHPDEDRIVIRPHLPAGLPEVTARLRVREATIVLHVAREAGRTEPAVGGSLEAVLDGASVSLAYPRHDGSIDIFLPEHP